MNSEELIGAVVVHRSFGKGVVKECVDNHIKIEFANVNKVSTFVYPECFVKFLYLANHDMQDKMQLYLDEWKTESGYAIREEFKNRYYETERGM